MSFGASGCCMHPFIQEETDNIVLQINRYSPKSPTAPKSTPLGQACGVGRCRRYIPAARQRGPHRCRHVGTCWTRFPDGACIQLGIGGVATTVGWAPVKIAWAATRR